MAWCMNLPAKRGGSGPVLECELAASILNGTEPTKVLHPSSGNL
jgi:hypothetical protein